MSTGLNCEFIEPEAGKWYYVLERGSAPKDAFSWLEYADAYGPFKTEDDAWDHLNENHANPGGASVTSFSEGMKISDNMKKLIENARSPKKASHFRTGKMW